MTLEVDGIIQGLLGQKKNEQIVLGIAGGSGSGKSMIAKMMMGRLSEIKAEHICLDRFFLPVDDMPKYYSHYLNEEQPNFNRPDSIDFTRMINYCQSITGLDLVILEGHFALYREEIRNLMDIKTFVTIDIHEMLERRTRRNLEANYGGDRDNILNYNRECVLPMYYEHIIPTQKYADVLIPNSNADTCERDAIIELLCKTILITKS
jgi:uridine kinase